MSIHVMNIVWERAPYSGSTLLVLLALADHADDGGYCFPGVPSLARKTRQCERNVRYCLRKLEKDGFLDVSKGGGPRGTNLYRIRVDRIRLQDLQGGCNSKQGDCKKVSDPLQELAAESSEESSGISYRLFFNSKTEAPHVCSIDEGGQASEIVLQGAQFHGIFGKTGYDGEKTWPEPKFWIEFEAVMEIEGGIAIFQG